ncbi:MAG: carbohydrate binding domain-containing protein [Victivallales bacterium]|nr:carbohydrate binding domain-containing protein [Victivallales bacterium]
MKKMITCLSLLALAAFGEIVGPNLIKNPGFEDVDENGVATPWKGNAAVYKVVDGGRNGGKCMSFTNNDPKNYQMCTIPVDCEPGMMYEFSCWVKTEDIQGNDTGATICLEAYGQKNEQGGYLGGGYPGGIKGTKDWTLIKSRWQVPTNATRTHIVVYVRSGMTGKAWFDDVSCLRYNPPLVRFVTDNLYRGLVAEGPVEFRVGMNIRTWKRTPADVRGSFSVYDADGNLVKKLEPKEIADSYAAASIDSADLQIGKYRVVADFAFADGTHRGTSERWFEKVAKLPERKNYIDEHKRLIVDGKPFFPLGMYWSGVNEADLDLYAKTPFNTLMPYGSPNDIAMMDKINDHGLKIIYSIKDAFYGTTWCPKEIKSEEDEERFVKGKVDKFKNHPALLAWYINDELPVSMIDHLAKRQKQMEAFDPDHPTWVVLYQYKEVRDYMDSFDVIGTDPYPIPGNPGKAAEHARTVREQTYGLRAFWQVPQAFDWACYRKTEEERAKAQPPTEDQIRTMSWQAIVNGANGLIYYSFFDLRKPMVKIPFEESFGRVCRVAAEIKPFIPVIMSIEPAPTAKLVKGDNVDIRIWNYEGATYLLAVNSEKEAVAAEVSLGKAFAEASNVLGTKGGVTLDGGKLSLQFAGYEAKMIVLK